MSTVQLKARSTSAGQQVVGRFILKTGTLLTAISMGRVIVTSIWSIGMTPLSTPMIIRGKFSGREDCNREAIGFRRHTPTFAEREYQEDDHRLRR